MDTHTASDPLAQLAELLAKSSWRLRRGGKKELAALGLTFGQARALRHVVRAPEPLRIGDLAAHLEIVPRSATATVDALEAAGLVARRADSQDRRSVLLEATTEGLALIERMDLQRRESATAMFGRLAESERAELLRLLSKLCESDAEAT
jgi:DNA-binding MarR family transcriptional regulator